MDYGKILQKGKVLWRFCGDYKEGTTEFIWKQVYLRVTCMYKFHYKQTNKQVHQPDSKNNHNLINIVGK